MRSTRLFVAVACFALGAVSCSGDGAKSPLAPSVLPAALQPGEYWLTAYLFAPCTTVAGPLGPIGPIIPVTVTKDGTTWVVRPSAGIDGTLTLRLAEGASAFGLIEAAGTISGSVTALRSAVGPVTMTYAGATGAVATVRGALNTVLDPYIFAIVASGSSTGQFTERSSAGTFTCQSLQWGILQSAS